MERRVLVVDDEKNIVDMISYNLKKEGYEVVGVHDGESGLAAVKQHNPDLVLLDIMMPGLDGYEVCRRIREFSEVPVIMLTARAEELDKVLGLSLGADDYVTKPFSLRELMARVKANLRKSTGAEGEAGRTSGNILDFGEIRVDPNRYEVLRRGVLIELTRREFDLMYFLARNERNIYSREMLLESVWGYEYFGDLRTVDVTIRRLRTKIEDNPDTPRFILTKRGVGYYFASPARNN